MRRVENSKIENSTEREINLKELEKANHENFIRLTEISISQRLRLEISSIKKRSIVNLFIGISFAICGVVYLIFNYSFNGHDYLYNTSVSQSQKILFIIETISVTSVLQIFSLFFLKLHRNGIGEIKNFHNEITDLELKFIAISIIPDDLGEENIYKISELLFKSNRDIVLKKGETTENILREKFVYENDEKIQKTLMDIINALKGKNSSA